MPGTAKTTKPDDDTRHSGHPEAVPHPSVQERVAHGRAARKKVPRDAHSELPTEGRPDPVSLLEQQAANRVAELVPIRYGRMLTSPFAFYRGAALLMASDLKDTPRSGINTQVCGDAHLMNFGVYASPERRLEFGINDFDETHPGPWEWDVKRLAASFAIAGRENGYTTKERKKVLLALGAEYRAAMHRLAGMSTLEMWYSRIDVDDMLKELRDNVPKSAMRRAEANIAKARTRDSHQALEKLTHLVDGEPRIISSPPLVQPLDELFQGRERSQILGVIEGIIRSYRRTLQSDRRHLLESYRLVDIGRKVVGVGSVGTRAFIILLLGRDNQDPLFLQAKEAQASVLEAFVGHRQHESQGERVVAGQHLMQATSDIFLGWDRVPDEHGLERDYYVRQLRDWKGSAIVEAMVPRTMAMYGLICASALARAHARSGDRIALATYLGNSTEFDEAIATFAEAYADLNDRDYAALVEAEKSGRITTIRGL